MVGMKADFGETIITFDHSEKEPTENGRDIVQATLDKTSVLVCHNVAHDLVWLWESGLNTTVLFLIQCWVIMFCREDRRNLYH